MKAALAEANCFSLFAKFISSLSAQKLSFCLSVFFERKDLAAAVALSRSAFNSKHAQFDRRETLHEFI
jgi:hypothetical protein